MPKLVAPKEAELVLALAQPGAPNARPGGPSAGGSEGRRVPQRDRSGTPSDFGGGAPKTQSTM